MLKTSRSSVWLWMVVVLLAVNGAYLAIAGEAGFANPPAPLTLAEQAMGGESGPFYPSAVSTRSGGVLPASAFTSSQTCGRSGCHPDVVAEWSASAHRFSGLDNPWYRSTYEEMEKTKGKVPARWCAGCHTPALLVSGMLDGSRSGAELAGAPAASAGVSCLVCHAISRVKSTNGQGDYELDVADIAEVAGLTASPDPRQQKIADRRLRQDPAAHRRAFLKPLLATSELCSTCHRAHMDKPINGYRYMPVMDDYTIWQTNNVAGFPQPMSCVDCHMPHVVSHDAGNEGGRIRSHRFAAANTALPALRHDRTQLQAVVDSLRAGRIGIDLFAMSKGRPIGAAEQQGERLQYLYAPLDRVPATLRRGESTRFDVVLRAHGIGHLFPGGKFVFKDAWVELKATDDRGRVVFWSGRQGEGGDVDPGAHFVSGLLVDEKGERVEGYDIWKERADAYSQYISPESSFVARFRVDVPADAGDALTLTARLNYRKFRPAFTRWAFARLGQTPPKVPVVTMAETSATLPLVAPDAPLPDMDHPAMKPEVDFERWTDYAYGLTVRRDFQLAHKAYETALSLKPADVDTLTTFGSVNVVLGEMDQGRARLDKAFELKPGFARVSYYLGLLEQKQGHYLEALEHLRRASQLSPGEARIWKLLGRTLFLSGEYRSAVEAYGKALAIEPQDPTVHFTLAMCYRALGEAERSQRHKELFERFTPDPFAQEMAAAYLRKDPHANAERQPLHEHRSADLKDLEPTAGRATKGKEGRP